MLLTAYPLDQVTQLYQSITAYNSDIDALLYLSPSSLYRTTFFVIYFAMFTISVHLVRYQDESKVSTQKTNEKKIRPVLTRQMTSIGRFTYKSETCKYPSNISWFVAMAGKQGSEMSLNEFEDLWRKNVMNRHERFRSWIKKEDDRFFEVGEKEFSNYCTLVPHPQIYRKELQERLAFMLGSPMNVYERLWEVQISNGSIGASGMFNKEKTKELRQSKYEVETLALFRAHHSLADGVSVCTTLGDVSDEADHFHEQVELSFKKQILKRSNNKLLVFLGKIIYVFYFLLGSVYAISLQFWNILTGVDPFENIVAKSDIPAGARSTSWMEVASLKEVKEVVKRISEKTTINDVFVSCITAAIVKQLKEHSKDCKDLKIAKVFHITVPVHLRGGVLRKGEELGNKIGAFVTSVPACSEGDWKGMTPSSLAAKRLINISKNLRLIKSSPAPLISWTLCKFFSDWTPKFIAKKVIQVANAKSVAVISNVRGFTSTMHWNGRPVAVLGAFLPLPPCVPIGIVVSSYAGKMSFTVDADKRAVPDADRFAEWVVQEYNHLKQYVA